MNLSLNKKNILIFGITLILVSVYLVSNVSAISINCMNDSQCNDNNHYTFDKCINNGTQFSYCNHAAIPCSINSDCGDNELMGDHFCQNNNVFQNFFTFTCNNGNTLQASCSNVTTPTLLSTCSQNQICSNATCINSVIICTGNSDCNDGNLYTQDTCINAGTNASYCNHTTINCINNNDCGFTGLFGQEFCSQNNVFKMFQDSVCMNAGTVNSFCNVTNVSQLVVNCGSDYCSDFGNNYCNGDDVYHLRTCYDKSCSNAICFTNQSNDEELVQNCTNGCSEGACIGQTQCVSEGGTIPVVVNPPVCCSGLSLIPPKSSDIFGIAGICTSKCGNNVCDSATETSYNCPHDCKISCSSNSDCGTTGFFGNNFCQSNSIFGNLITYICNNPGTSQSFCSNSSTVQLRQDCGSHLVHTQILNVFMILIVETLFQI